MRECRYLIVFLTTLAWTLRVFGDGCKPVDAPKEGIVLNGATGHTVTFDLKNPAVATAPATIKDLTFCWLSEEEMQAGKTCTNATRIAPSPSIMVGRCVEKTSGTEISHTIDYPQFGSTGSPFDEAKAFVINYTPSATRKEDSRYLRVEWKLSTPGTVKPPATTAAAVETSEARMYRVSFAGLPADFTLDPRFKLWLYTGYAFMYSRKDFSDSFAELRLHSESRWADGLQRIKARKPAEYAQMMKDGSRDPKVVGWAELLTFRSYGEVGLSSTTATTPTDTPETPSKARRSFDLGYGLGFGKTWVVAVENPEINTNAFSTLLVAHVSHISIPGQDEVKTNGVITTEAVKSKIRFGSSFGIRVENETGHFKGAYGELGWGESSQFELQKTGRAKFDGYLPFNDPGLLRVAARLQTDIPSVFAKLNPDRGSTPAERSASHEAIRAGDVKITILFNIDIRDLMHRLGTPAEVQK